MPAHIEIELFCTMSSQVLQWTFAAAPGHPALREMCDHIARSMDRRFSGNKNFDTLERTGPGPFTDVILNYAQLHPLSKVSASIPKRPSWSLLPAALLLLYLMSSKDHT